MATGDRDAPESHEAGRAGGSNPRDTDQEGDRKGSAGKRTTKRDRKFFEGKMKGVGLDGTFIRQVIEFQPDPKVRLKAGVRRPRFNAGGLVKKPETAGFGRTATLGG